VEAGSVVTDPVNIKNIPSGQLPGLRAGYVKVTTFWRDRDERYSVLQLILKIIFLPDFDNFTSAYQIL